MIALISNVREGKDDIWEMNEDEWEWMRMDLRMNVGKGEKESVKNDVNEMAANIIDIYILKWAYFTERVLRTYLKFVSNLWLL